VWVSVFRLIPPMPLMEQQRPVPVDTTGIWQTSLVLSNGDFQVQVSADMARLPLPIDNVRARTVTVSAPQQTSIYAVTPDGGVPNDFITGPGIITILGSGEPGASVEVSLSSVAAPTPVVIAVTSIAADGTWSATTPTPLVAQGYVISALASVGDWTSPTSRSLSITDAAATLGLTSLHYDTGSNPNDGITSVLPREANLTTTPGSRITLHIPELDAQALPGMIPYEYYFSGGLEPSTAQMQIQFLGDSGLTTFTYRFVATAPNGSTAEVSRIVQLDRTPLPIAIVALGSNDGTDPNDSVVATGTPLISGYSEPGAQVHITIVQTSSTTPPAGGLPGLPPGLPGGNTVWLPTTPVTVAADGTWSFQVPVNLPQALLPYELTLSATRPLSGFTSTLSRSFIVEANASVLWDNPPAITYGTALGAQQLDAVIYGSGNVIYTPPAGTILGAGTHQLTVLFTPADPVLPPVTAHVDLTVLAAPLTITANNATRVVGSENPAFTVSYVGFIPGEDATVLSVLPLVTTEANASSPIATYPLLVNGAVATNYEITYVHGLLTVTGLTNDNLSGAQVLTNAWSGSLTANNTAATREATEPLHAGIAGGRSLWYQWTAPADGLLEFNTLGSSFDTLLALYTKTTAGALRSAGANDNRSSTIVQSLRTRTVLAGQVYFIAVDGKADTHGPLVLSWVLRSGNDRFVEPQNLGSAVVGTVNADLTHTTSDANELDHAGAAGGRSVWFLWTAPQDGILVLETSGSQNAVGGELDTVLALYTGDVINRLKNLGAEDDDRDSLTSAIGAKVTAGTMYRIVVDVSRNAPVKNGTARLSWLLRTPIAD
jgi:MBG domain (YGX type)